MKKPNKYAQLEVLYRFAHMLDEYSVQHLAANDKKFEMFVDDLYQAVDRQADKLLAA